MALFRNVIWGRTLPHGWLLGETGYYGSLKHAIPFRALTPLHLLFPLPVMHWLISTPSSCPPLFPAVPLLLCFVHQKAVTCLPYCAVALVRPGTV